MSVLPTPDTIYVGDAAAVMRDWPAGFVDLVLTSPPYFNLRDYGVAGQIGLESSVDEYTVRLLEVVGECGRVLKPTGSLYLNLGDTYRGKSLLGIPWRVALALMGRGWLLRNAIVWHKPNGLPTPIKDRLNATYELVFHLTRQRSYYFDLDAIRVPQSSGGRERTRPRHPEKRLPYRRGLPGDFRPHPLGKNPGDVWAIGPEVRPKRYIVPGAETSHFAPYPESLCERPILAASPPGGTVLDPFMGSGTTALVSRRLGRHFLGIELSPEYARLARRRLDLGAPEAPGRSTKEFKPSSTRRSRIRPQCSRNANKSALSFSSEQEPRQ